MKRKIITVSREFGSGGRELAKRLADYLSFSYYDHEVISAIANETNLDENYVDEMLQKGIQNTIPIHISSRFHYFPLLQQTTDLMVKQTEFIKKAAQKSDSIFVGRASDILLKEYQPLRIFVYADMESKLNRCKERASTQENLSDKDYIQKIKQVDKERSRNYDILSNTKWGHKESYDLCINTSNVEIKSIIPSIAAYIENWFGADGN